MALSAEVLIPARPARSISGQVLHIRTPLSFWGGVDPRDGRLIEPGSSHCGTQIGSRILVLHQLRGSSSASSVLLELIHRNAAPAAIILSQPDAILGVAMLVAREMNWPAPPILRMSAEALNALPDGAWLAVSPEGAIRE